MLSSVVYAFVYIFQSEYDKRNAVACKLNIWIYFTLHIDKKLVNHYIHGLNSFSFMITIIIFSVYKSFSLQRPFWHSKLIKARKKPKPRKLDGNLLIFIASHPFSVRLFFLKHPVWIVNVASSWTRHSWITVLSCHCEGRHTVLMQTNVNTFPLEITWCLLLWRTKYFLCRLSCLYSYGRIQCLAEHMLPSYSVPGVAFSCCQY